MVVPIRNKRIFCHGELPILIVTILVEALGWHSYGNCQLIDDLPIKDYDFPQMCYIVTLLHVKLL
jgi:hypothetical protein